MPIAALELELWYSSKQDADMGNWGPLDETIKYIHTHTRHVM